MAARSEGPPLLAIAMLSAAALGYEILLMRLFSIIQWHHFAYMMISVALLGYGAAGTFVALFRRALVTRYVGVVVTAAAAFGIGVGGWIPARAAGRVQSARNAMESAPNRCGSPPSTLCCSSRSSAPPSRSA